MKNFVIFLMAMAFLFSCQKNKVESLNDGTDSFFFDFNFNFVIVDEDFQDRLNPVSPAYYGEEYVEGIKLLDAQKKEFDPYAHYNSVRSVVEEEMTFIQPPYRWFPGPGPGYIYQGTHGYYFIRYSFPDTYTVPDDDGALIIQYIRYPDGDEDEIKVRVYRKPGVQTFDRIWINDELAFEGCKWNVNSYYNPKYFKWLGPVMDGYGKQIGDAAIPIHAFNLVLIK